MPRLNEKAPTGRPAEASVSSRPIDSGLGVSGSPDDRWYELSPEFETPISWCPGDPSFELVVPQIRSRLLVQSYRSQWQESPEMMTTSPLPVSVP